MVGHPSQSKEGAGQGGWCLPLACDDQDGWK